MKNKTVVILSGVSGSGKSTLISKMCEKLQEYDVVSADHYWIRPDGVYDWNFKFIGEAHKWCKSQFQSSISEEFGYHTVFVDNTNLTLKECEYYIANGLAAGYDVLIVDMVTDLDAKALAERNVHRVPLTTIEKMLAKKESAQSIVDRFLNGVPNDRLSATTNLRVTEQL